MLTGVYVMVIGMMVVVAFLCLLIFTMHVISKLMPLINKIIPEEVGETCKMEKVATQNDKIAVVIAAVKAYAKG